MSEIEEMVDAGMHVMGLIAKAKEEGIDTDEYERMMEKGLTEEQREVAEERCGERVRLTGARPQTDEGGVNIPNTLDKLEAGKKIPWIVTLDGVDFVVKAHFGEGSHPHSKWSWREDGFKFIFYKSRTEDTVHSLSIRREDNL